MPFRRTCSKYGRHSQRVCRASSKRSTREFFRKCRVGLQYAGLFSKRLCAWVKILSSPGSTRWHGRLQIASCFKRYGIGWETESGSSFLEERRCKRKFQNFLRRSASLFLKDTD